MIVSDTDKSETQPYISGMLYQLQLSRGISILRSIETSVLSVGPQVYI